MVDVKKQSSTPRIEPVGLVNKEGQWYSRVGVSEGDAPTHPVEGIVESGYACRDGVWYKCLTQVSSNLIILKIKSMCSLDTSIKDKLKAVLII